MWFGEKRREKLKGNTRIQALGTAGLEKTNVRQPRCYAGEQDMEEKKEAETCKKMLLQTVKKKGVQNIPIVYPVFLELT